MSTALARGITWCSACTTYLVMTVFDLPRPLYLPEHQRMVLTAPDGEIAMSWYGAFAITVLVAGLVSGGLKIGGVAAFLGRLPEQRARRGLLFVIGLILLQALGLAGFELIPR